MPSEFLPVRDGIDGRPIAILASSLIEHASGPSLTRNGHPDRSHHFQSPDLVYPLWHPPFACNLAGQATDSPTSPRRASGLCPPACKFGLPTRVLDQDLASPRCPSFTIQSGTSPSGAVVDPRLLYVPCLQPTVYYVRHECVVERCQNGNALRRRWRIPPIIVFHLYNSMHDMSMNSDHYHQSDGHCWSYCCYPFLCAATCQIARNACWRG